MLAILHELDGEAPTAQLLCYRSKPLHDAVLCQDHNRKYATDADGIYVIIIFLGQVMIMADK